MQYFIEILNFIQAIAWPLMALLAFNFFSDPLKEILLSMREVMHKRGIKVSKSGVEIPGNQSGLETIQDVIEKSTLGKRRQERQEGLSNVSSQGKLITPKQGVQGVSSDHEKSLVDEISPVIQDMLERNKQYSSPKELLKNTLIDSYICLYFERSYQRILKSQLVLLKKLQEIQLHKMTEEEAQIIFQSYHDEQEASIEFKKWLNFLEKAKFIKINGNIQLSAAGREFLEYIAVRGYQLEKLY
jgi:hypothetical protein